VYDISPSKTPWQHHGEIYEEEMVAAAAAIVETFAAATEVRQLYMLG
jgi:hypothetical protein